jgi:hypothetical protein
MGVEASFQAMPENCDLFITARQDRETAEALQFFHQFAFEYKTPHPRWDAKWTEIHRMARKLGAEKPDLINRYFYAGSRTFDAIVYLLSPVRRSVTRQKDTSLIYQTIYGQEPLHPEAHATQGRPIGLITSTGVSLIAEYLEQMSKEILHEHYNPKHMSDVAVYKIHPDDNEARFENIWDEFVGMREIYRAAAYHGEAVITVID